MSNLEDVNVVIQKEEQSDDFDQKLYSSSNEEGLIDEDVNVKILKSKFEIVVDSDKFKNLAADKKEKVETKVRTMLGIFEETKINKNEKSGDFLQRRTESFQIKNKKLQENNSGSISKNIIEKVIIFENGVAQNDDGGKLEQEIVPAAQNIKEVRGLFEQKNGDNSNENEVAENVCELKKADSKVTKEENKVEATVKVLVDDEIIGDSKKIIETDFVKQTNMCVDGNLHEDAKTSVSADLEVISAEEAALEAPKEKNMVENHNTAGEAEETLASNDKETITTDNKESMTSGNIESTSDAKAKLKDEVDAVINEIEEVLSSHRTPNDDEEN